VSLLAVRPSEDCRYDLVALGEVMLRFDPGDGRIATTRTFAVSEGGGEYNVARGLRRCFGLRSAIVTAFADNPVGRLLEDLILQGGVDPRHIAWMPYDGVGRDVRNGLNFVERGYGVRAALGCSDRGHSAAAAMRPGDVDWDAVFGTDGARWFHCGGIFAALSAGAAALALEAMAAARRHGTIVSFDLNYRPSLWKAIGGPEAAAATNRELVGQVDVLFGNEEDFSAALGFEVPGVGADYAALPTTAFRAMIADVIAAYPNINTIATTLRRADQESVVSAQTLASAMTAPSSCSTSGSRRPHSRRSGRPCSRSWPRSVRGCTSSSAAPASPPRTSPRSTPRRGRSRSASWRRATSP